jgi:hypothetical protein
MGRRSSADITLPFPQDSLLLGKLFYEFHRDTLGDQPV